MEANIKLMVVFGKMAHAFQDKLSCNLEELGMPFGIYPILAHLNEVGRAKTQKLGEVAVITSGTITHTVNKMVKLGYVDKVQDEEDRRVFWVQITAHGREDFSRVHEEHIKYLTYLLEDFSEEEIDLMTEQMKKLGKIINDK